MKPKTFDFELKTSAVLINLTIGESAVVRRLRECIPREQSDDRRLTGSKSDDSQLSD